MTTPAPDPKTAARNDKVLRQIVGAIELSRGRFNLLLVRAEGSGMQARYAQRVTDACQENGLEVPPIWLGDGRTVLVAEIERSLAKFETLPDGLQVLGLGERTADCLDAVLAKANQMRDRLRDGANLSIVLWLDDAALARMVSVASDLHSWATSKRFRATREDYRALLRRGWDDVLDALQAPGAGARKWTGLEALLPAGWLDEVMAARAILAIETTASIEALVAFGCGRRALENGQAACALAEFEKARNMLSVTGSCNQLGWIEFQVGVARLIQGDRERRSVEFLDSVNGRFIAAARLCSTARWKVMEASSIVQLVVCRRDAIAAERDDRLADEVDALEQMVGCDPLCFPHLFLNGLDRLRALKFRQGEYVKAFAAGRWHQETERQYGLRAFVGAGRLQPLRGETAIDPIPPEIGQFGRGEDLKELVKRIRGNETRLVVVCGASGVGKSSLIQAGLVPRMATAEFDDGREGLAIVVRHYKPWTGTLRAAIAAQLRARQCVPSEASEDVRAIVQDMRTLAQDWVQPVLVFDQFEEFFFAQPEEEERWRFFTFLGELFAESGYGDKQLTALTVVLSLREDYIHLLLPADDIEAVQKAAADESVLDPKVLYRLKNLSGDRAVRALKEMGTRFSPELCKRLVSDLAVGAQREVRPIELQIAGAQLETERCYSLAEYEAIGESPKAALVERYVSRVVEACGEENAGLADSVLFLLTDDAKGKPIRPVRGQG